MKLLDWVHRKFRQNNGEVSKDYTGSGPSSNCLCLRPSPEEPHLHRRRPCHGLFAEAGYLDGDREAVLYEGLLNIGTLGSGPIEEPEPEADGEVIEPMTVESIAQKDVEVATEAELIMVEEELEKVLLAEAEKEDADGMSSARPSHAGGKGATVTPTATCPLQGFLFGSTVEAADTVGRQERRASLGELFMMSRVSEEGDGGGKVEVRGGDKKPIQLVTMKKLLQGCRNSRAFGSSYSGPDDTPVPSTKFHKILKIFHRKVHPENNVSLKKHKMPRKQKTKENVSLCYQKDEENVSLCYEGMNMSLKKHKMPRKQKTKKNVSLCYQEDEENVSLCYEGDTEGSGGRGSGGRGSLDDTFRNDGIQSFKSRSVGDSSSSDGSHEYWIKTDSDYLVLEL